MSGHHLKGAKLPPTRSLFKHLLGTNNDLSNDNNKSFSFPSSKEYLHYTYLFMFLGFLTIFI